MTSEKKPSIYSDRSNIGSSDELDEYGVWVKSEPQDLSSIISESRESSEMDLPDFDADMDGESLDSDLGDMELEDLDFPEESPDTEAASQTNNEDTFDDFNTETMENIDEPDFDESGFEELSIPDEDMTLEDDLSSDESTEATLEAEGFTEVSVDDFLEEDTEAELSSASITVESGARHTADIHSHAESSETTQAHADLSTQLLMRIAEELSSIKSELTNLKKEFAGIKVSTAAGAEATADAQHGGFFSEEEDEKIALTGDELDNILNTADFTEEAGEDVTEELEGEFSFPEAEDNLSSEPFLEEELPVTEDTDSLPENLSDQEDIIGLEDEIAIEPEESSTTEQTDTLGNFENIEIETEDSLVESFDESLVSFDEEKDSEELQQLRIDGATPMTPAPEDTSYLEEDPLAQEDTLDELSEEISLNDEAPESIDFNDDSFDITVEEEALEIPQEETSEESLDESIDEHAYDEASLDLSDAVIDEPDLSGEINENPLQEPSSEALEDLSEEIELDMESLDEDTEEPFIEPTESLQDDLEQVIPEGFVVDTEEPLESLDDDLEPLESEELSEFEIPLDEVPEADEIPEISADDSVDESMEEEAEGEEINLPSGIRNELKTVLSYMDQLLESLPEEKIEEFAKSEYFDTYKKLFKELGLV